MTVSARADRFVRGTDQPGAGAWRPPAGPPAATRVRTPRDSAKSGGDFPDGEIAFSENRPGGTPEPQHTDGDGVRVLSGRKEGRAGVTDTFVLSQAEGSVGVGTTPGGDAAFGLGKNKGDSDTCS